nr:hypothetical protein JVH1_0138 [Rhodococcus sp. JVH1]
MIGHELPLHGPEGVDIPTVPIASGQTCVSTRRIAARRNRADFASSI